MNFQKSPPSFWKSHETLGTRTLNILFFLLSSMVLSILEIVGCFHSFLFFSGMLIIENIMKSTRLHCFLNIRWHLKAFIFSQKINLELRKGEIKCQHAYNYKWQCYWNVEIQFLRSQGRWLFLKTLSYSCVSNWQKLQVTFLSFFSSTEILKMSFMSWLYRFDSYYNHPLQSLQDMCILSYKKSKGTKKIGKEDHFLSFLQVFSCYPGVFSQGFELGEITKTTPKYVNISFSCSTGWEALVEQNPVFHTSVIFPYCYEQRERKLVTCLLTSRNLLSPFALHKTEDFVVCPYHQIIIEWQWVSMTGWGSHSNGENASGL